MDVKSCTLPLLDKPEASLVSFITGVSIHNSPKDTYIIHTSPRWRAIRRENHQMKSWLGCWVFYSSLFICSNQSYYFLISSFVLFVCYTLSFAHVLMTIQQFLSTDGCRREFCILCLKNGSLINKPIRSDMFLMYNMFLFQLLL